MSRRTMLIAAALLLLVCARMPAWRGAGAVVGASERTPASSDAAQEWSGANTTGQLAPTLRRQLGLVLTREGS